MSLQVRQIVNANIYLNGESMLGRAEEIKVPDIQVVAGEYKGLGMVGKIELPTGFDKLEGEIKWKSFYEDVMGSISNPFQAVALQCRSSVEIYDATGRVQEKALVTHLQVMFKKPGSGGTYKQHERVEWPSTFACHYIKQTLDGLDILELDYFANIAKINGEDMLANYRANLGV